MANEVFAERAVELLAAFIETNLPTRLAEVETLQSLQANELGRPGVVLRGVEPAEPRDGKVEVYAQRCGPENLNDRTVFSYALEVVFTLHSGDAQLRVVQKRMWRWISAWWRLMSKGGSTLNGTVQAALCSEVEIRDQDPRLTRDGSQRIEAVALVEIVMQEA